MKRPTSWIGKLLIWRIRHLSDETFVLVLSVIMGVVGGLVATLIKWAIHFTHQLFTENLTIGPGAFSFLIYPFLGILLTVLLIKYAYRGQFAHGITNVLYAISKRNSIVRVKDFLYFLGGSFITVGMGGSVGMEATLVMTGSGLGSNLARLFRLPMRNRILLLGCGAAASLSAFFNAPIAGVIFALEVLMLDLTMASLMPLLTASVTGIIIGRIFLQQEHLLSFTQKVPFDVGHVPYYIMLGIVAAFIGFYLMKVDGWVEQLADKMKGWWRPVIGACIVGLIIFLFPPLFGEGYAAINSLLNAQAHDLLSTGPLSALDSQTGMLLLFLLGLVLLKAFAVAFTLNSGGIGGYFAPSLFMGATTGYLFAHTINLLNLGVILPEFSFTLVGMAGAMSSVFYAPLTAIFLIAEITSSYGLIIPLMIVSTISYIGVRFLSPHSLFTRKLASRGELITHHKDKAVLALLHIRPMIETNFQITHPDLSLGEFLKESVATSARNLFPVIDEDKKLLGIVLLNDVRPLMFKQEQYDEVRVHDLMRQPPEVIYEDERMDDVVRKFDKTDAWNLPVVDRAMHYRGFISRSKLLTAYRDTLRKFTND